MRSTPRTRKAGEALKEALAEILVDEVADPRLQFVTVTSVEVSPDLGVANVYVIAHGDAERYAEVLEGLQSARGRIRTLLGRRVRMMHVPELHFRIDTSVDEGMRISEILRQGQPATTPGAEDEE